jgi:hypothetical protein
VHIKKSVEEMIDEDALSLAEALGVSVAELKNINVSLYDILAVRHDEEVEKAFSSARSVFRAAGFYIIKSLLKNV